MMGRHPAFQQIRAFALADGNFAGRPPLAAHLEECQECRDEVSFVRQVVLVARERLAPAAPPSDWMLPRILARRDAGGVVILPTDREPGGPSARSPRIMRLTVALLFAGAGVAAALPGSPIRVWIRNALWAPSSEVPLQLTQPPAAARREAGVSISIAPGEMWVAVEGATPDVTIRLRVTNESALAVRAIGDAADAEFSPRASGIGVSRLNSGVLEVDVPHAAHRFALRIGRVTYVVKDGERLQVLAPGDSIGAQVVFSARR